MTNRKKCLLGILGLCFFAAVSFAYAQDVPPPDKDKHMGQQIQEVFNQLHLTDQQKQQLDANKNEMRARMQSARQQLKDAKQAIRQELMKPQLDMAKVTQLHNQIKTILSMMEDDKLNSILAVRSILTPDQFVQFGNLMQKHKKDEEDKRASRTRLMAKGFFKRFDIRVVVAIVATISCVVFLSDFLVFRLTYKSQIEGMRQQLKTIAQTAALLVDAERLAQIPLSKDGMHTPAYDYVEDQIRKIKIANPQIKDIYTLKKVDSTNIWRFVNDAENESAQDFSSPGDKYDAGRFPEMLRGYNEPSADRKIETDEFGSTLSGYAPVRDSLGQPVAVLGVDLDAGAVHSIYYHVLHQELIILLTGIIMGIILGFLISSRVVGPVNHLIAGTRYIADGNLHYRVQIKGDDEIKELADSFNNMAQSLEESRQKLLDYFYDAVKSLVLILEYRDQYTMGHSQAVANYSEKIARHMGIDTKTVEMLKRVTLLHDIGKVGVRDSVLHKPGKLNEEEWENIKSHPVLGWQILKPILNDPNMLAIIRNHHERQDGKGYPDGLTGSQISLLVAIVTVADSYDAMTANRPYRKGMSQAEAIDELEKGRGKQFHPDVVDAFLEILKTKAIK